MDKKDMPCCPGYVKEALLSFGGIMDNSHHKVMEDFNRANKGEMFALHFLYMRNEPVLPSELSTALRSSMARISALLGSLEKKGLVKREINTADRRNILVTLTESGRQRARREMDNRQTCMAGIFKEMGEADTRDFIRLTKRFAELAAKHMRPPGDDESNCIDREKTDV